MRTKSEIGAVAWWGLFRNVHPYDQYAAKCIDCGKTFTLEGMITHVVRVHIKNGEH